MSKAPETIYIDGNLRDPGVCSINRLRDSDIAYIHHSIAYTYASAANREIEGLRKVLTHISRNASVMTAHQIETMARDALTKEG